MTIQYLNESSEELAANNASLSRSCPSKDEAPICHEDDQTAGFETPCFSQAFKIDTIHEEEADEASTSTTPTTCSGSCCGGSSGFIYESQQTCPIGASALKSTHARYIQDHKGASARTGNSSSGKRAVWKDKNGKARYTLHDDIPPKETSKQNAGKAVAAAAMTAGVVTGSVVGLLVLGPLGLVVGGVGGVASGASALIGKRQFRLRQQQNASKRNNSQVHPAISTTSKGNISTGRVAPVPEPPGRTFSGVIKVST